MRAILAQNPEEEVYTYPTYEHDYEEDTGEIDSEETASVSAAMLVPSNVHRIHRINVHESPILACSSGTNTVYVILDTGATASLITIKKLSSQGLFGPVRFFKSVLCNPL